jgi:serine/threonine-protein kinase
MAKGIKYFGDYKIIEQIGRGGMAKIYTAIHVPLNRVVVVKEMVRSPGVESHKRFKREALLNASLSHPNIVEVYDYFSIGSSSFLVMQYIDGINLAEIIEQEAPLHPTVVAIVGYEICQAISYAHKSEIIHRDIKPTNILISREGQVKVSDFGVAKSKTSPDLTSTGTIIGTPYYMSPEQASGKKVSYQSDIYSIGVVLYEMLTGKRPFKGDNTQEVTVRISRGKYKSPLWLDPHHSLRLSRIMNKAMKKNPKKRYKNAERFKSDLEKFAGWKNLAQSDRILQHLILDIDQKMVATTVMERKRAKKKKKGKKLFWPIFLVIIIAIIILFLVKNHIIQDIISKILQFTP